MSTLNYLQHYPAALLGQVQALLDSGQLGGWLARKYPESHDVQTDKALYQYVSEIKLRYLKNAALPAKVRYDSQQHPVKGTLGTNTFVSRVQGGKLKTKNEIRVAALFRDAPLPFLRMIVVHELAHLKEKDHNKAFYQLCCHMEPDYHQLEFDMRVWLTWRESQTA
ncbi:MULTISPECIES: M48 family metallopeptidase [unclassified Chromobacterium]|uniref:M48 metallopeptidase family protein n=1 Tax=unclassified Chromobacterium TaxID=2641838 RepID=UPI000D30692D|nr:MULTISPECIES: M48 family metallopeptidase [unclassified Chromobacterium]MCP1291168.1 M48 family metallopeptidase [Chromobacterium sp. S0633]PTU67352.1 metal-dependent hydrolase [Chromobacterium sp. Panama]UJB32982.1 M48 family metallopeptidase [Chromobacterium sp. Beijing]